MPYLQIEIHVLHPSPSAESRAKAICCRIFTPAQPEGPAASVRDYCSGAYTHMLRHGCGFALANAGHDTRALQAYLGHRNIQHTVRYTELAPDRFKTFWLAEQSPPRPVAGEA